MMRATAYTREANASSPWFPRAASKPQAKLRLFCFPYAGGGATIYRGWSDQLPDVIDVCPVQIPGRETRLKEVPFSSLSSLVQSVVAAILPRLDMPFALFGHSMGSLIAFELARLLRREYGLIPMHLFVSGRGAPHVISPDVTRHKLPDQEFLESLRELNGMPEEMLAHTELMKVLIPILRADFAVCETYTYSAGDLLDCPITALGGIQDLCVTQESLQSWREQTQAAFRMRMLPGDHFFINSSRPLVTRLIAQELYWVAVKASESKFVTADTKQAESLW